MKRTITIRVDREFYQIISDFKRRMELKKNERIPFTDATRLLANYMKEKNRIKRRKYDRGFMDFFGLY